MRMGALGLAVVLLGGCTSLLGTFEVVEGTSTPASADASVDATSDTGVDAGPDAAAFLMTCKDALLLDVDPGKYQDKISMYRLPNNQVRVITRQDTGPIVSLTFSPRNGAIGLDKKTINGGQPLDVKKLQDAIAVMTWEYNGSTLPPQGTPALHIISDTTGQDNLVPLAVPMNQPNQNWNVAGTFLPLGADDFYFVVSYPDPVPNVQRLAAGRRAHAPANQLAVFFSGPNDGTTRPRSPVSVPPNVYVFDDKGPDANNPVGTSFFVLPDNGKPGATAPTHLGNGPHPQALIAAGPGDDPTGMRAGVAEVDFSVGAATPGLLRAGKLPVPSMDPTAMPTALTVSSLSEAPVGGGDQFISGDDFVWAGRPPEDTGLNLYWYDMKVGQIRARQGGATRLLKGATLTRMAIGFANAPAGPIASFDVVWIDPTGGLKYALISCVR